MIFLIAGPSHTGKTALARRLVERYRANCLSIDHLKMGLIRSGYTTLTPHQQRGRIDRLSVAGGAGDDENCHRKRARSDRGGVLHSLRLDKIQYRCIVMSEEYICAHYDDIKAYANVAEQRLDDSDCTLESLLHDNARARELCRKYGVPYTLIENDYRIEI